MLYDNMGFYCIFILIYHKATRLAPCWMGPCGERLDDLDKAPCRRWRPIASWKKPCRLRNTTGMRFESLKKSAGKFWKDMEKRVDVWVKTCFFFKGGCLKMRRFPLRIWGENPDFGEETRPGGWPHRSTTVTRYKGWTWTPEIQNKKMKRQGSWKLPSLKLT